MFGSAQLSGKLPLSSRVASSDQSREHAQKPKSRPPIKKKKNALQNFKTYLHEELHEAGLSDIV